MLKIAHISNGLGGVLLLAGSVARESLAELELAIADAKRLHREVSLDLSEVTLIDHAGAHFLAQQSRRDVRLVECPEYIEPWIGREDVNCRTK